MGTDCLGHVELLSWGSEPGDPDELWLTALVLDPMLVDRNYRLFCRLFGVRCADVGRQADQRVPLMPIAPRRGLPANAAADTLHRLRNSEDQSWTTPSEVAQAFQGLELDETEWGWQYVRDSVRLFAEKLGPQRVRLVVGFSS